MLSFLSTRPFASLPPTTSSCPSLDLPRCQPSTWSRSLSKKEPTLYEAGQHLASRLQQRMPDDDLHEPLQALAPMLNHVIAEPVCEHLAGQRRDGDARRLALEDVAKVLKVAVAPPHGAAFELEGGDVGAAEDLVGRVHAAADAVRLWVTNLADGGIGRVSLGMRLEQRRTIWSGRAHSRSGNVPRSRGSFLAARISLRSSDDARPECFA